MDSISKYKKILILLIIAATSLFAGYYFLFRDLVNKNTNNGKLLSQINSESDREVYATQVKRQLASMEGDINKVQDTIIASDGVVNFIEKLETIARNNGLSIKNNSISEETDSKLSTTTTFLKIRSETYGSWLGTYRFLYELESLPYKVRINTFNMGAEGSSEEGIGFSTGNWNVEFEIKLLKYK